MTASAIAADIARIETEIANWRRGQGKSLTALRAAHRKLYAAYLKALEA